MRNIRALLFITFLLLIHVLSVEAGVLMTSENESSGQFGGNFKSTAYIDRDRMRVDTKGDKIDQTFIFRKDRGVFWTIDNREKTLMEMTKEDLRKMKNKMDEAMRRLEEQMRDMPPEQRRMMEEMMKGRMPEQAPEEKTVYRKVASREKINKWVTDKYAGYENGMKVEDVWTTDWKALGLSKEDFKVFEEMEEFFSGFSAGKNPFLKPGSEEWEKKQGYPGIPVKTLDYSGGKISSRTELKEVKKQNFKPSLFDVPSGLRKIERPF